MTDDVSWPVALKKRFEDSGSLNVGGFSIGWPLFRAADGRTLVEEYGTGAQPTFVAQFSESGRYAPAPNNSWSIGARRDGM